MAKSFSDRLKELVERLEECSNEFSEAIAEIDEDCVDLNLDDLPDIIRELKWLSEDIEAKAGSENEWIREVKHFQDVFEKKIENNQKLIDLRARLIREEINELWCGLNDILQGLEAFDRYRVKRGMVDTLDAIADSIIVLIGTANVLKMDLNEAMKRVFASNLSKLGADSKPIYNEFGKVMKGPNFKPPVLDDLAWDYKQAHAEEV